MSVGSHLLLNGEISTREAILPTRGKMKNFA